jgi:hypothetical protein
VIDFIFVLSVKANFTIYNIIETTELTCHDYTTLFSEHFHRKMCHTSRRPKWTKTFLFRTPHRHSNEQQKFTDLEESFFKNKKMWRCDLHDVTIEPMRYFISTNDILNHRFTLYSGDVLVLKCKGTILRWMYSLLKLYFGHVFTDESI